MSSVNSIASEKLVRLLARPNALRSSMCVQTMSSRLILALSLVPFGAQAMP
jgi:hypothetical protein